MLYISISIQFPSIFHLLLFCINVYPISSTVIPYSSIFHLLFYPFPFIFNVSSSVFINFLLLLCFPPFIIQQFSTSTQLHLSTLPWNAHCFTGCLSSFQMVILCFGPAQQDCSVFIIFINSCIYIYIFISIISIHFPSIIHCFPPSSLILFNPCSSILI